MATAAIWRRIGIMADASGGVVLRGYARNTDLMCLQRFMLIPESGDSRVLKVAYKIPTKYGV